MNQLHTASQNDYFSSVASVDSLPSFGLISPTAIPLSAGIDVRFGKRANKQLPHATVLTLESLPVGVLLIDQIGLIEFANSALTGLMQISQAEITGKTLSSVVSDIRSIDEVDSVCKLGTVQRKDGSVITVEVSENDFDLGGTERKIVTIRKVSMQEEFARLHRDFIAKVVHELKTPLASFTGVLSMLEEGILGQLNEQGRKTTVRIKQTCKRLVRLVDDMLDIEKMHAGKFLLEQKKVNLQTVLKGVIESARPLADNRKLTLSVAKDVFCWADEDRLIQVVLNLLANAIKNSPDGSCIKVCAENTSEGVKISVLDQGRGIPSEKLTKIFDVFEQVEILDAKLKGGTGLGLAICKSIVSEHGGEIGVNSKLGQGSCFWLTLPTQAQA